uniref:Epi-alfa-bisabolol synthase n=1 Tax=Streptomyces citricolor TaxID=212427 RepID=G5EKN0_9ACTN|nr:epi-alfa-bisabolol synthase [Streptomyces citricolor]
MNSLLHAAELAPKKRNCSPRSPEEFEAAVTRHTAWAVGRHLLAPQDVPHYRLALPDLIGHAYPRARGPELDLLLDILGWFTILDDRFDGPVGHRPKDAHALIDPLLGILRYPGPPAIAPEDPLVAAWRDLWHRQAGPMPDTWRHRAAAEWQACLTTFLAETHHRAGGTTPDLPETALLRRHASCLYPFMNMLERVRGTEAPALLLAEPALYRLRAYTADAATLINDLCSLQREEGLPAVQFNMVMTLQRTHGLSRNQAVQVVRTRVRRLRDDSEVLRGHLLRRHPAAGWYLNGTRDMVDGLHVWAGTSRRYHP